MKKVCVVFAALLCSVALLAGCSDQKASDELVMDGDLGTITVYLPLTEDSSYTWSVSLSDESVAELLTSSDMEGEYVASFRGLEDGTCTLNFAYASGADLLEIRTVEVEVEDGKITGHSDMVTMDIPETSEEEAS